MRAKYCKCLNTYTINGCDDKRCKAPYYWKQGIGSIYGGENTDVVNNVDTTKSLTHVTTEKEATNNDSVTNINTKRTITN